MWFPGRLPQTVLVAISFCLRQALWLGLCVADSFGQHLANWPWSLAVRAPPSRFAFPGYRALPWAAW
jgi:hypothetical protein